MKRKFHITFPYLLAASVCLSFFVCTNKIWAGEVSGTVQLLAQSEDGKWSPASSSADAVVFVTGFDEPPNPKKPQVYLDQSHKDFSPRVVAVTMGQTVISRNQDEIYHNVWSLSAAKSFDLGSYKKPEERKITFDKPGLVSVFCNVHPQMIASVLVLKNNKYFVTGPKGDFHISGIPSGNYELRIWTEGVDPEFRKIVVTSTSKEIINFAVKQKLRSTTHLNKEGKPYEKY